MRAAAGFTLIELMIGLALMALLLGLGAPSIAQWLHNSRIRTSAETLMAGLNLARNEALKRNDTVRFQLAGSLDPGCLLQSFGTSWVVSLDDPTGQCDLDPSETAAPRIIQKKSGDEGGAGIVVDAGGATTAHFNGVGRLTTPGGAGNITQIDISNPAGGACEHVSAGPMRCLRITIGQGGQIRMCDPAISDASDPRRC